MIENKKNESWVYAANGERWLVIDLYNEGYSLSSIEDRQREISQYFEGCGDICKVVVNGESGSMEVSANGVIDEPFVDKIDSTIQSVIQTYGVWRINNPAYSVKVALIKDIQDDCDVDALKVTDNINPLSLSLSCKYLPTGGELQRAMMGVIPVMPRQRLILSADIVENENVGRWNEWNFTGEVQSLGFALVNYDPLDNREIDYGRLYEPVRAFFRSKGYKDIVALTPVDMFCLLNRLSKDVPDIWEYFKIINH